MRTTPLVLAALIATLCCQTGIRAEPASTPTADRIAAWIRDTTDTSLDKAVRATTDLDAAALRQVYESVRRQTRVEMKLHAAHLMDVKFLGAPPLAGTEPPPIEKPLTDEERAKQGALDVLITASPITMRVTNRRYTDILEHLTTWHALDFVIGKDTQARLEQTQITITLDDVPMRDALDQITAKAALTWKLRGPFVVLSEK